MKENPDLADRIVASLDDLLRPCLRGEAADAEEHKMLVESMARIVRKELINFLLSVSVLRPLSSGAALPHGGETFLTSAAEQRSCRRCCVESSRAD